jgi:hypothetical protein
VYIEPKEDFKEDNILPGYARVTEILAPWNNFSAIDPDVLANAADRGTRVHKYCEEYAKLWLMHAADFVEPSAIEADCRPYVQSYIAWFNDMVQEVHHQETRLYSEQYRICGKPDQVVRLKGDEPAHLTLLEIKTPQIAKPSWALQTAAYDYLIESNGLRPVARRIALILDKNGGPARVIEYSQKERDIRLFIAACELHRFFNPVI